MVTEDRCRNLSISQSLKLNEKILSGTVGTTISQRLQRWSASNWIGQASNYIHSCASPYLLISDSCIHTLLHFIIFSFPRVFTYSGSACSIGQFMVPTGRPNNSHVYNYKFCGVIQAYFLQISDSQLQIRRSPIFQYWSVGASLWLAITQHSRFMQNIQCWLIDSGKLFSIFTS